MRNKRDSLLLNHKDLFHKCWGCQSIGLKPGILDTKHGDYGMRDIYKNELELPLNQEGLCENCEQKNKKIKLRLLGSF